MLSNNDNKAIMETMNISLILDINITFFVDRLWWRPRTGTCYEGAEFLEWDLVVVTRVRKETLFK